MPRWVVGQKQSAAYSNALAAAGGTAGAGVPPPPPPPLPPGAAPPAPPPDNYADKLVKYVPAEVLAFALPAAAVNAGNDTWLKAIIGIGVATTPLYHFAASRTAPPQLKPKPAFYALSAVAFVPWILGASLAVAQMTGWGQGAVTTILLLSLLIIPLLDQLLD